MRAKNAGLEIAAGRNRRLVATLGTPAGSGSRGLLRREWDSRGKRRPRRSRGRRRFGSLPPVSQLYWAPTASCPADICPFPRRRSNLHFLLPTLVVVDCSSPARGFSSSTESQSRVRDQLGHRLPKFPLFFSKRSSKCAGTATRRRCPFYTHGLKASLAVWLGDRTYKLSSGTTSEYGRYVKSLGEPCRGEMAANPFRAFCRITRRCSGLVRRRLE